LKSTSNINNLHKFMRHLGEASARLTGKALGMKLSEHFIFVKSVLLVDQDRKTCIKTIREVAIA
jgi:uncharacterized membrane protein YjjP (DUF1212 family)